MNKCRSSLIFISLFFSILLYYPSVYAASQSTPQSTSIALMTISDIHFNPFASCKRTACPLAQKLKMAAPDQWSDLLAQANYVQYYGQDTNFKLLMSALAEAKEIAAKQQVFSVIVLGDFLAHHYKRFYQKYTGDQSARGYQLFVRKTFIFLNMQFKKNFPSTNVYMIVGNNDSYLNNYVSTPGGAFFKEMGALWSDLIITPANRLAMQQTFSESGYYAVNLLPDLRLIALNTNLFSYKARGTAIAEAANKEMQWLHQELMNAAQQHSKVILAMHIPQSIIFSIGGMPVFSLMDLWKLDYKKRINAEYRTFASSIAVVLMGHLHTEKKYVFSIDQGNQIQMRGSPSISPIFGNNPGLAVYIYSPEKQRLLYSQSYEYLLDQRKWEKKEGFFTTYLCLYLPALIPLIECGINQ